MLPLSLVFVRHWRTGYCGIRCGADHLNRQNGDVYAVGSQHQYYRYFEIVPEKTSRAHQLGA